MNNDRGIIKWLPFNSIVEEQKLIAEVIKNKSKIAKPNLSPEQLMENEAKILEAFFEEATVTVKYYKKGFLLKTTSKISHLNPISKQISLANKITLLFNQIIQINIVY